MLLCIADLLSSVLDGSSAASAKETALIGPVLTVILVLFTIRAWFRIPQMDGRDARCSGATGGPILPLLIKKRNSHPHAFVVHCSASQPQVFRLTVTISRMLRWASQRPSSLGSPRPRSETWKNGGPTSISRWQLIRQTLCSLLISVRSKNKCDSPVITDTALWRDVIDPKAFVRKRGDGGGGGMTVASGGDIGCGRESWKKRDWRKGRAN
ncbi:uncharacterized protein BJX67DRAFT_308750 [Aspergillus lucknowensis]|uniref:Uncharacterized protein n=1 Tax=Aspergillus lucknowensis TaxID=176173 RepID=A0ABR4M056_9EURO